MRQRGIILKGYVLRVGFEKEVERIVDRHLRNQIHLHSEFPCLLRYNQPRQKVRLRILLPVQEVILRQDAERIA